MMTYYSAINTSTASSIALRDQRAKLASISSNSRTRECDRTQVAHKQTSEYTELNTVIDWPQFYTRDIAWTSDKLILEIRILCTCIFPSGVSKTKPGEQWNGI